MYAQIAFANHAPQMNKIDRCSGQPNPSWPIENNAVSDRKIISHFGQCFSIEVFIHDEKKLQYSNLWNPDRATQFTFVPSHHRVWVDGAIVR